MGEKNRRKLNNEKYEMNGVNLLLSQKVGIYRNHFYDMYNK